MRNAHWLPTRLGEVLTLINGRAYKQHEMLSAGTPLLRIQNLNGGSRWYYSTLNLPEDKYCEPGDLLYAWSATFGPYIYRGPRAIFHYHIWNVVPSNAIYKRFAFYELMRITDAIKSAAHGVAMPHITKAGMEAWELMLPPPSEQKRIADKLDALLTRVESCRERLNLVLPILKSFRQSVLAAATTGELTCEWREERGIKGKWPTVALRTVASDLSYGSAAKSSKHGNIPVLRMGNIQDGLLDWSDLVFTSDDKEISKYQLSAGDVLFNRTNSPELVGKTAVFRGEREAIYAGYLIRVRCGKNLLPDYLNYCLGSPAGREYCRQVKSDGVSQSNINAKKLAAFSFGLPSVAEQREIVRRAEDLLMMRSSLDVYVKRTIRRLDELVSSALDKAFRGQLVPQDPNDEPATALLTHGGAPTASLATPIKDVRDSTRTHRTKTRSTTNMITRKNISHDHLSTILKERGALTAEALWAASRLEIDDFYDQLKDEEVRGLLQEKRGQTPAAPRVLEPAA